MNQNTQLDLLHSAAKAALWMAIPAGIALGLSIKAFEAVYPPWFFPGGCLIQVLLYIAALALVDKLSPHESMQARIGCLFTFFLPLPLYILMESSDADWSHIRVFSPFIAWATPLILFCAVLANSRERENQMESKS